MTTCDKCSAVLPPGISEWAGRCEICIDWQFDCATILNRLDRRQDDCRCSKFGRCEPCIGHLMEQEDKAPFAHVDRAAPAPTFVVHRDACIVEFIAPSMPCETCGVEEGTIHLPTCSVLLDVEYDGVKLRNLVEIDQVWKRDEQRMVVAPKWWERQGFKFTTAQRAAISAHWSAQLRAKIAASKAAERNVVTYCEED